MHARPSVIALAVAACATPAFANPFAEQPKADDVFYHFMPIAWRDGDNDPNRFGDFVGMTDSLQYLDDLGVTALWMNPIFPSPAYHGYQHGRADELNPRFGTEAQFLTFVSDAHARSIEVYLDFVVYGISHDSPWYDDAFANPASIYDDWLAFTNGSNTQSLGANFPTWNGANVGMTHWDLRTQATTDLVIDWSEKWLDPNGDGDPSDGIDGYRLDHVWVNYGNGPAGWGYNLDSFWAEWHAALRTLNPDVFTFAEQHNWGSHGGEYLTQFDGAMTKPFEFAARDAVRDANASVLYGQMQQTIDSLPVGRGTYVGIIGDHDVDRLASVIGADAPGTIDRAKAAAAVLMLQPFPPIIYYGDEIAMTGTKGNYGSDANDIPMREPFKWNAVEGAPMSRYHFLNAPATNNQFSQNNDGRSVEEQTGVPTSVLETYRSLIDHRHDHVALRRGDYDAITADDPGVWAFLRSYESGEAPIADASQAIVCAINLSGTPVTTSLDLTDFVRAGDTLATTDLATGAALNAVTGANASAYAVTIPAYGYVLIEADFERAPAPKFRVDGLLEESYVEVASTDFSSLYAGIDGDVLYLATLPAQFGFDRFILISDGPSGTEPAPWGKSGTIATYDAYVGNEVDNGWAGWFDAPGAQGVLSGQHLECAINLRTQYGTRPDTIFLCALSYGTGNGESIINSLQVPAGDGDDDVSFTEFLALNLADLEPISCASDYNGDGIVDIIDFGVFGAAFGSSTGDANYNADTDSNTDGVVDIIDFGVFGTEFGREDCPG